MRGFGVSLAGLVLVLLCGSASAAAPAPTPAWVVAEEVASLGLARQDPLLLTMAARMKLRNPGVLVQPTGGLKGGQTGGQKDGPTPHAAGTAAATPGASAASAAPAARPHPRSPEALLQRARALAQDRPDLLALIDDVATDRTRGITAGPRLRQAQAAGGGTDIYREVFQPSEPAAVLIAGDGESNLDLYVFDASGKRICASEKLDDVEVCRWQPQPGGGPHVIHVVNRGRAANQYELRSN